MAAVVTAAGVADYTANRVETVWSKLRDPLLEPATKFWGHSWDHQWGPETWRWNEQANEAMQGKCAWFKAYKALQKRGKMAEANEAEIAYNDAKHMTKHTIWLAKSETEKGEFATVSLYNDGVFCIAKEMDHSNQDIIGENCVCNDAGELALTRWRQE